MIAKSFVKKRLKIPIIVAVVIFAIPFVWYIENIISIEISKQNYINVEKSSPAIEITGTIDFPGIYAHEVFFIPEPDEIYKIEYTGVDKAILVNSFIDPSNRIFDPGLHDKKVRITGVLVNDDPSYGKSEKTYDAIIIVQAIEILN